MSAKRKTPESQDPWSVDIDQFNGIEPERIQVGKREADPHETFVVWMPGEPHASVSSSLDYNFATSEYPKGDLRRRFADAYRKNLKELSIRLYNVRFDSPSESSEILNVYIYLYEDDPTVSYRIEDTSHILITTFYETLEQAPLPSSPLYRQFLVKNIRTVMRETLLHNSVDRLETALAEAFPEVVRVYAMNTVYLFVRGDAFDALCADPVRLAALRTFVYNLLKEEDVDRVLRREDFHIRVDNVETYIQTGGHHYFNSDYMYSCPEI